MQLAKVLMSYELVSACAYAFTDVYECGEEHKRAELTSHKHKRNESTVFTF